MRLFFKIKFSFCQQKQRWWLWTFLLLLLSCSEKKTTQQANISTTSLQSTQEDLLSKTSQEHAFPLLIWTVAKLQESYVDPNQFSPQNQFWEALESLSLHRQEIFFKQQDHNLKIITENHQSTIPLDAMDDLHTAGLHLEQVLLHLRNHLSLHEDEVRELEHVAINGFLAPLDSHTLLLNRKENAELEVRTTGKLVGIGVRIDIDHRRLRVVQILPDSPAEKADVRVGDLLIEIDGQRTLNMRVHEAEQLLRGPVHTHVNIVLQRNEEVLHKSIQRQVVELRSVVSVLLPEAVAYVKINQFQENTALQFKQAITNMQNLVKTTHPPLTELRGLILDLRGNNGGLLTQALELLDQIVKQGELVIVYSRHGRESQQAKQNPILSEHCIVTVLMDESSASASEVVSGAIKQLHRGMVLGRTSFGKGTVQMLVPHSFYGLSSALKLTIAEYFVAGEQPIQARGVTPHISLTPVEIINPNGFVRYYDQKRFERRRERGFLKQEYPLEINTSTSDSLPIYYLNESTENPQLVDASIHLRDPEVGIAYQATMTACKPDYKKLQESEKIRIIHSQLAKQYEDALIRRFTSMQIDWRSTNSTNTSLRLQATLKANEKVTAGTPFKIHIEVENTGSQPAERVHIMTSSPQPELDGLELLLGRIEAGKKVVRNMQLQLPSWQRSCKDVLTVHAYLDEPKQHPIASEQIEFFVAEIPRPHLAYDYWIDDDAHGNGDGNLQPKEEVKLVLRILNDGASTSPDVRALLRNPSGTQQLALTDGFAALGPLQAGQSAIIAFDLNVDADASVNTLAKLELVVADVVLHERMDHILDLPIVAHQPAFQPRNRAMRVLSEPARAYMAADGRSLQLFEVPAQTEFTAVGEVANSWIAVEEKDRRRMWIPANLVEEITTVQMPQPLPKPETMISPPLFTITAGDSSSTTEAITIQCNVTHPQYVHDVVVVVGTKKIFYQANPQTHGPQSKRMEFSTQVPLEKGKNHILLTARSRDGVKAKQEICIFRP